MKDCKWLLRAALFIMNGEMFRETHPVVKARQDKFVKLIKEALEV
jgi:hypothetical protein